MPLPSLKCWPILFAMVFAFGYCLSGCSKNAGPKDNRNDSDTVIHRMSYDSAKFYVSFEMAIYNTSGVYTDTFSDFASMIIYVVNGVVKVPHDSIVNLAPLVFPSSGTDGFYNAVWVPDDIGTINITNATGMIPPGTADTMVVMTLTHSGTVTPKWQLTAGN